MVHLECYERFIKLPGVFVITLDHCHEKYGEDYRHRLCVITNAPWLSHLSADCPGPKVHDRKNQIGFGGQYSTRELASYPQSLVTVWARLFSEFIMGREGKKLCPWCAHIHGGGRLLGDQRSDLSVDVRSRLTMVKRRKGNVRPSPIGLTGCYNP